MCTYEHLVDATLPHGLMPAGRPAAAHHHPRRRSHRPGHRVDQLPQRAAARVGHSRWTSSPARARWSPRARATTSSTPSPTPTAPSATPPGCGSSSSRCRPFVALRHVPFDAAEALLASGRRGRGDRQLGGCAGRCHRRGRVRPGRAAPDARHLRRGSGSDLSDYTWRGRSTTTRCSERRDDLLTMPRPPVALGRRLVLVLGAPSGPAAPGPAVVAAALAPLRRLPAAGRPGPSARPGRPARPAGRPARRASGWSRTSRCRWSGSRSS